MLDQIKKAALDIMESTYPVAILEGTVTRGAPLRVKVDQKYDLDRNELIIPKHITQNGPIQVGSKLILIRVQGGQKFLIFDEVS